MFPLPILDRHVVNRGTSNITTFLRAEGEIPILCNSDADLIHDESLSGRPMYSAKPPQCQDFDLSDIASYSEKQRPQNSHEKYSLQELQIVGDRSQSTNLCLQYDNYGENSLRTMDLNNDNVNCTFISEQQTYAIPCVPFNQTRTDNEVNTYNETNEEMINRREYLSDLAADLAKGKKDILERHVLFQALKVKLFLHGSRVHKGKGAERLFADYWDALGRYLSMGASGKNYKSRRSNSDTAFNGVERSMHLFLSTNKLRKLHNQLILGLLGQCYQTKVSADIYAQHIPSQWTASIRYHKRKFRTSEDKNKNSTKATYDELNKLNQYFGLSSGTWTASGNQHVFASRSTYNKRKMKPVSTRFTSATIPGLLEIHLLAKSLSEAEGMTVSNDAVGLLAMAARNHVTSLLRKSITSLDDSSSDLRSLSYVEKSNGETFAKTSSSDVSLSIVPSQKDLRSKMITPLVFAGTFFPTCLNGNSPIPPTSRLCWERCISDANNSRCSAGW